MGARSAQAPRRRKKAAGAGITLHSAATSLPKPPSSGGDVSSWNSASDGVLEQGECYLVGSGDVTLSNVELFGKVGSVWYAYGLIAGGADIVLSTTRGFRFKFEHSPQTTDYAIGATMSSATGVTATVIPVAVKE